MWRGFFRLDISVSAPFVWRCLSGSTVAPFSHPAHRTDVQISRSGSRTRPHAFTHGTSRPWRSGVRARSACKGARVDKPRPASPDLVLEAQPPAQPHSGVAVDRPIRLGDGAYLEVVRPSAQRAVQLLHQLCGRSPCLRSGSELVDGFHHAPDALL